MVLCRLILGNFDSAIDFIDTDSEFSKTIGNITNLDDRLRIKVYELYEDMYNCRAEHIRVIMRGEDEDSVEIYIPSAKKCIEAVNRFLAVDFDYYIDPDSGQEVDQQKIDLYLTQLFKRDKLYSKFGQLKRYMLIKGDALWHIQALPWERPGRRIMVKELKPEHWYPIEDLVTGRTMGGHIVDIIRNPRNTPNTARYSGQFLVRRQTYRKVVDDNGIPTGGITSELTLWEIGRWDDRTIQGELVQIDVIQPEFVLPPEITQIPVYHWANNPPPNSSFGMSELAGVETVLTAINQSMSDEDLTLITQGLGVYWTDASPPIDELGNETEWEIGPGAVVQVGAGSQFSRVSGVSSVSPFRDHVAALDEAMCQAIGVPDIAIGMVDVATAESGIALQLKLGPLLAKNAEKEILIVDTTDIFFEDLVNGWLPAYEGIQPNGVVVTTQLGDPMPVNQSQQLQDILSIWTQAEGTMPVSWLYDRLNEIFGWDLDVNSDFEQAIEDATKIAGTAAGPQPQGDMGDQMNDEVDQSQPWSSNGQYSFSNS